MGILGRLGRYDTDDDLTEMIDEQNKLINRQTKLITKLKKVHSGINKIRKKHAINAKKIETFLLDYCHNISSENEKFDEMISENKLYAEKMSKEYDKEILIREELKNIEKNIF